MNKLEKAMQHFREHCASPSPRGEDPRHSWFVDYVHWNTQEVLQVEGVRERYVGPYIPHPRKQFGNKDYYFWWPDFGFVNPSGLHVGEVKVGRNHRKLRNAKRQIERDGKAILETFKLPYVGVYALHSNGRIRVARARIIRERGGSSRVSKWKHREVALPEEFVFLFGH